MKDQATKRPPLASLDAESVFVALSSAHPGPGQYLPVDQHRDFMRVFLSTDDGRRVLHEILLRANYFGPTTKVNYPIDPYSLAMGEGKRRLGLSILTTINNQPPPSKPTEARRTKE